MRQTRRGAFFSICGAGVDIPEHAYVAPGLRLLACLALAVALAGCGETDKPAVNPATIDAANELADAVLAIDADDVLAEDTPGADADETATDADVSPQQDVLLTCPGQAGCPCLENGECVTSLCIDTAAGQVCAQSCTENCASANDKCVPVPGAGGDITNFCVPRNDWLCDPCTGDKECNVHPGQADALCVDYGLKGAFCGTSCLEDASCPDGYACKAVTSIGGATGKQCQRKADDASGTPGSCPCSDAAKTKKLVTKCYVENKDGQGNLVGKCPGTRTCGADGLGACNGPPPAAETCDGIDNDCNGKTDENTCNDNNPCTADVCAVKVGVADGCNHTQVDIACDADGSVCTENDTCKDGACSPGVAKLCDDGNPCTVDACDPAKGCSTTIDEGKTCDADGDACTVGDLCVAGKCATGKATACDDGNLCTSDSCDQKTGKCVFAPVPDGVSCDDSTACTSDDQCGKGTCVGKPLQCDDKNPCTAESCDPLKGCQKSNADGAPCDDDNPCTLSDTCEGGDCLPGKAKVCAGGDQCVTSKCDLVAGKCTAKNKAAGEVCDDGSKCTTSDACLDGDCQGKVVSCDDGNPCSDDACQMASGCTHTDNVSPCDDGNACTLSDSCMVGGCVAGKVKVCDDGNACTADTCDTATGKCKYANTTTGCDDASACTGFDVCKDGACAGVTVQCDDGNVCTSDGCDKTAGCTNLANTAPCNDNNACTDADACAGGSCAGKLKDGQTGCDDGNVCTGDSCDPKSGCVNLPNQVTCDDGNPCTVGDACAATKCEPGANTCQCGADADCASFEDDSLCNGTLFCDKTKPPFQCAINPATVVVCGTGKDTACLANSCTAATGKCALAAINEGKSCDADASVCTQGDVCTAGQCQAGASANCDDGNVCTNDSCDAATGCAHVANTASCNADDNACTAPDACAGKVCLAGKAKACDDGSVCTVDSCDVKTGICVFDAAALAGKGCDADASLCTDKDACAAGKCVPGKTLGCDDGAVCTDDSCDDTLGCLHAANTAPCNADDNACTEGDACLGKLCIKGKSKLCDDNNPCTVDSCDTTGGACVYDGGAPSGQPCDADGSLCTDKDQCVAGLCTAGKPLGCDDGNVCTGDACDAKNGCGHIANTMNCNADNSVCTENDACKGSACVAGSKKLCDDGNPCTNDSCDAATGCLFAANTVPCDDANVCTIGDLCAAKACVPGKGKVCDDGAICTDDGCDPVNGCQVSNNTALCDDGNPCTNGDACLAGKCKSGGNTCGCQADGDCVDDGNLCNGTLFCDKSALPYECSVDKTTVVNCDPGADTECSKNLCDAKGGKCAVTAVNDAKSCSDGDACSTGDACAAGACQAGGAANCDDGNPCTTDACAAKTGCSHVADTSVTAPCYDGPAGTSGVGVCKGGTKTCDTAGSFGACKGEVVPAPKESCNSADDDCNGKTDEGCTPASITWKSGALAYGGTAGQTTLQTWIGGNAVVGKAAGPSGKFEATFGFFRWLRAVVGK